MGLSRLSKETEKRIDLLFAADKRERVRTILLNECGNNLPFLQNADEDELNRFRFAALKISDGDLGRLDEAIRLAKSDWRDLLVAAGFAHNRRVHTRWLPEQR